jgi:tRNA G46 methylase TrmB
MQHDLFNYDDATQVARLLLQDRIFNEGIGAAVFFPSQEKKRSNLHRVLDIGCGPGGWVIDLARQLPQTTVIGIDSSPTMITYANGLAQLYQLQTGVLLILW